MGIQTGRGVQFKLISESWPSGGNKKKEEKGSIKMKNWQNR